MGAYDCTYCGGDTRDCGCEERPTVDPVEQELIRLRAKVVDLERLNEQFALEIGRLREHKDLQQLQIVRLTNERDEARALLAECRAVLLATDGLRGYDDGELRARLDAALKDTR